jgi:hypothetical protein
MTAASQLPTYNTTKTSLKEADARDQMETKILRCHDFWNFLADEFCDGEPIKEIWTSGFWSDHQGSRYSFNPKNNLSPIPAPSDEAFKQSFDRWLSMQNELTKVILGFE